MLLRDCPQVSLKGFHFHLMSHQLDVERHLALMQRYFQVVKTWQQEFELGELMINLGGGMGLTTKTLSNTFRGWSFATS